MTEEGNSELPAPGRACRFPRGRPPTPEELAALKEHQAPDAEALSERARQVLRRHEKTIEKAKSRLAWAEERGRHDLVARRKEQLERATRLARKARNTLKRNAQIAAHFEKIPEQLKANKRQAERWKKEREREEKERVQALKTGRKRNKSEGLFEKEVSIGSADRNVRHDVLEYFASRQMITTFEKECGDRFKKLFMTAHAQGARGVDFERAYAPTETSMSFVETMLSARNQLEHIEEELGRADFRLLVKMIVVGKSVLEIANELDGVKAKAKRQTQRYVGRRFRDALAQLTNYWSAKGKSSASIRSWLAEDARPSIRRDLHETKEPLDKGGPEHLQARHKPKSRPK